MVQPVMYVIDTKTPISLTLNMSHNRWHLSFNEMQWLGAIVNGWNMYMKVQYSSWTPT